MERFVFVTRPILFGPREKKLPFYITSLPLWGRFVVSALEFPNTAPVVQPKPTELYEGEIIGRVVVSTFSTARHNFRSARDLLCRKRTGHSSHAIRLKE